MISIWKLIYDLEYWIHIGTGDDIVNCPGNRREFQHLVNEQKELETPTEKIPGKVLIALHKEASLPFWKRRTFWVLVRLWIKKIVRL